MKTIGVHTAPVKWYFQTAFTRCRHILKTVKNMTDRPPVHTKTAHFCRQIYKTVDFEIGTLTGTFWKRHRVSTQKLIKKNIFQCFCNETDRFLECRCISLGSKSYDEFFTVRFPTVFKMCRHHVKAILIPFPKPSLLLKAVKKAPIATLNATVINSL